MLPLLAIRRHTVARLAYGVLFATMLLPSVRAQAQARNPLDPNEQYRRLMEERMRQSQRIVEEIARRRFEEHKDEPRLASDALTAPGVVRAISPAERQALAHTEKGLDYFDAHKFEQAIKEYDEAIRICPTLAAAHNNLGSVYFALTQYDAAVASFQQAVKLDTQYGQAYFNLALAYLKLGREQQAGNALTAATQAYVLTGDEHLKAGRNTEAEAAYREVLRIDPNYSPVHYRLGLLYHSAAHYPEAIEAFKLALQTEPQDAYAYTHLGASYLELHKYAEAAAAAERAITINPQAPDAYRVAGLAQAALGHRTEALAHYNKLKDLHADADAQQLADAIEHKALPKP
ncbi:MAG: tetratricopeptide repeat protein [Pyrinomonadaceae bacterium]